MFRADQRHAARVDRTRIERRDPHAPPLEVGREVRGVRILLELVQPERVVDVAMPGRSKFTSDSFAASSTAVRYAASSSAAGNSITWME